MRNDNLELVLEMMKKTAQLDAVKALFINMSESGTACVSAYSKAEDYTDDDCRSARVSLTDREDWNREDVDKFMKEVRSW